MDLMIADFNLQESQTAPVKKNADCNKSSGTSFIGKWKVNYELKSQINIGERCFLVNPEKKILRMRISDIVSFLYLVYFRHTFLTV